MCHCVCEGVCVWEGEPANSCYNYEGKKKLGLFQVSIIMKVYTCSQCVCMCALCLAQMSVGVLLLTCVLAPVFGEGVPCCSSKTAHVTQIRLLSWREWKMKMTTYKFMEKLHLSYQTQIYYYDQLLRPVFHDVVCTHFSLFQHFGGPTFIFFP